MKFQRLMPWTAVVALVLIAATYVFRPLPTTIAPDNAARIAQGMGYAEVRAILGEPRDEVLGTTQFIDPNILNYRQIFRRDWISESTHVSIMFDPDDCVVVVHAHPHEFASPYEHFVWRVRKSLGLSTLPQPPASAYQNIGNFRRPSNVP